jgi:predicted short-subunit dehydrogenase-like oxidoreductase (DUF2520 family)
MVFGRGRLGRSLAAALQAELRSGRDAGPEQVPEGALVFLAVPDPAVAALATRLQGVKARVVHVSGALTLASLAPHTRRGAFHPYQSFPAERPPSHFEGALVGVDASDEELLAELSALAESIGARPRRVSDEERPLYHASAVFASNYVVALGHVAARVLEAAGWPREDALRAVLSLMGGVARNLDELGLERSLIGPIRRGDPGTVHSHLRALLAAGLDGHAELYRKLGLATLDLALEAGLDPAEGQKIERSLAP